MKKFNKYLLNLSLLIGLNAFGLAHAQYFPQITEKISTTDLGGNMVVNFKLKRPATELAANNKTTFWVAGYLPKTSFPFSTDGWFFFKPNGWERLKSTDHPLSVAYKINQDPTAETSFSIPTGMLKKDLELFNIEMHFAYMGADGEFTEMGVVWRKGE